MELDLYSVIQTLNARAAVVPVSQHRCAYCAFLIVDFLSHHVCSQCGKPQPIHVSEDFFSVFGVLRKFKQSAKELEKRFYTLSRALHPDRYSTSDAEIQGLSLQRMSWVNQAYATLKNPDRLRDYLVELEGLKVSGRQGTAAPLSLKLADTWFEIQDLWMEDLEEGQKKLIDFENELSRLKVENQKNVLRLEEVYDLQPSRAVLEKLAVELQTQSYLQSMEKDVERMKRNAKTN